MDPTTHAVLLDVLHEPVLSTRQRAKRMQLPLAEVHRAYQEIRRSDAAREEMSRLAARDHLVGALMKCVSKRSCIEAVFQRHQNIQDGERAEQRELLPPPGVELSVGPRCGLRCSFCPNIVAPGKFVESQEVEQKLYEGRFAEHMTFDTFRGLIGALSSRESRAALDEILYWDVDGHAVNRLVFSGGYEPLSNPDTVELISYARGRRPRGGPPLHISLYTNGLGLTESRQQALAASCDMVRVSVNAGTAEDWQAVAGAGEALPDRVLYTQWERMWTNVREMAMIMPIGFGVSFVLTQENYLGLVPFLERSRACRVSFVTIKLVAGPQARALRPRDVPGLQSVLDSALAYTNTWAEDDPEVFFDEGLVSNEGAGADQESIFDSGRFGLPSTDWVAATGILGPLLNLELGTLHACADSGQPGAVARTDDGSTCLGLWRQSSVRELWNQTFAQRCALKPADAAYRVPSHDRFLYVLEVLHDDWVHGFGLDVQPFLPGVTKFSAATNERHPSLGKAGVQE